MTALNVIEGNRHQFCQACRRHAGGRRVIAQIEFGFEVADVDLLSGTFGRQTNCDVAQFADVAGEGVDQQTLLRRFGKPERRQIGLCRVDGAKMFQQAHGVAAEVAQRRDGHREYRKPVVEVGTEAPLADFLLEVAIGSGDDARR